MASFRICKDDRGRRYVEPSDESDFKAQCRRLLWGLLTAHPAYDQSRDNELAFFLDQRINTSLLTTTDIGNITRVIYPRITIRGNVRVYFVRQPEDGGRLYFLGCMPDRHPTLSLLKPRPRTKPSSRKSLGNYLYIWTPVEYLEAETAIITKFNRQPTPADSWRWKGEECHLHIWNTASALGGRVRRFSKDEVMGKLTARCRIYSQIAGEWGKVDAKRLEEACSVGTARDIAMETTQLVILSVCYAMCPGYFWANEVELMRIRLRRQVDTPRKRKYVLATTGLVDEYVHELEEFESPDRIDDFFDVWVLQRYHAYIGDLCDYGKILLDNTGWIPEGMVDTICEASSMISRERSLI